MGDKMGPAGMAMGLVGGITGAITSGVAARQSKIEAKKQADIAADKEAALAALEAGRPALKNPYENQKNAFEDLNNPYANLTVSTEAFKMQAQQADQALANSLDVMMETGQAAGGATALAQAALQSKRGIAASIGAQEATNAKLAAEGAASVAKAKAQGEANLQQLRGQGDFRAQQDAIGFQEMKMERAAAQMDNALQNEQDARAARAAGIAGVGSSIVAGVGSAAKFIEP